MPTSARQPFRVRGTPPSASGGHTGRPYGPAFGPLVGAGFMPARTGFRFLPGYDGSTAVGAHCICALAAPPGSPGLRRKSQACQGGYIIRPYGCGWRRCIRRGGAGGHTGRPYGPAPGGVVGAGFMPARTGFRFLPGYDGSTAVGAHCICALAAPPGSPGLRRKSQACQGGYIIRPYGCGWRRCIRRGGAAAPTDPPPGVS